MTTLWILLPALVAGLLVILTHVPLGMEVLRRGIVFIDLAVAQAAALGMVFASWLSARSSHHDHVHGHGHGHDHAAHGAAEPTDLAAYVTAIACASGLYFLRRAPARIQEAVIGCIFVLAASASVLLLANHPQGGEHLKEVLVGQILWVSWGELGVAAAITAAVIVGLFLLRKNRERFLFYPLFAVAITLATQLVGVYLVFATLIIPALATYRLPRPLWPAYGVAIAGYLCGLALSVVLDSPSGAVVVGSLALLGILTWTATRVFAFRLAPARETR